MHNLQYAPISLAQSSTGGRQRLYMISAVATATALLVSIGNTLLTGMQTKQLAPLARVCILFVKQPQDVFLLCACVLPAKDNADRSLCLQCYA
jgi:hypothetical protein